MDDAGRSVTGRLYFCDARVLTGWRRYVSRNVNAYFSTTTEPTKLFLHSFESSTLATCSLKFLVSSLVNETSIRACKRQRDRRHTTISKVKVHANILSC